MSSGPGRNDPCPCGSGRKFKRCCALRPAVSAAILDDDFDGACAALTRVTASARFEEDFAIAHEMCFDAQDDTADDGAPMDTADDLADDIEALHDDLFAEWLWFDYLSRDRRTVAARALAGDVSALTPGARRVLAAAIEAPLRCLRVESIDPGERIWVTDLLEVTVPRSVASAYMSHDLARGDGLLARLAPYGERAQVLGTSCLLKPGEAAGIARMVTALRAQAGAAATPLSDRAVMRMFEGVAMLRFVRSIDTHRADVNPRGGSIIIAG